MSRYINRGNFGVHGLGRVNLLETINTGLFVADYREKGTGKRIRRRLATCDLQEAKNKIANLLQQIKEGKGPALQRETETILYVAQRGDDGQIKVGITRRLKSRLSQLQNGSAEKLQVLRVYKMADVEKAVHAELERKSRLEGEWFPADLLPLVDRFFNVGFDIGLKRARARLESETETARYLSKAGVLNG